MTLSAPCRRSICLIHGNHPRMCQAYPHSKGGVCKHHPERYYTNAFFTYQQTTVGPAIAVLRVLFAHAVPDPFSFEILTFLMDFGRFPVADVRAFFCSTLGVMPIRFDACITALQKATLIFLTDSHIEGISLKEVESMVDETCRAYGWALPSLHKD